MKATDHAQGRHLGTRFTRLKFTGDVSLGKTFQGDQRRDKEVFVHYVRAASIQTYGLELDDQRMWMTPEELARYQLRRGDVLIVEGGAGYGRSVVLREDMPAWGFQNHVIRIRPSGAWYGPFLDWAVKAQFASGLISNLVDGATIPALSSDKAKELPVLSIELQGQRRIADYLDRETAEIDAMATDLDRLVETLRERKAAVLRAPWEAEQTKGWQVRPLWSMFRRDKVLGFTDEPMVSVFRELGVVYKDDHDNLNVTATDRSIYQLIEPGWLVVNRMKAWQGSVGVSSIRGITSGHYICFRPLHSEDPRYLNLLFRSPQYRDWFAAYSRGVRPGQAEIDNSYLDGMPIVVPAFDEQQRIVAELDAQTARIDDMIADANRLKALLAERRSTLITDVVTGRKEVPA